MYCVEFMADKTPGVDTGWDALHTFIRIPAGAVLAAGAVGDVAPAMAVAAGIVGGGVTAATHATKAGSRVLINTSPEPFSNWGASIAEDIAVIAGLWAALQHPMLFLAAFVLFLVALVWLLPRIWRAACTVFRKLGVLARLDQAAASTRSSQRLHDADQASTSWSRLACSAKPSTRRPARASPPSNPAPWLSAGAARPRAGELDACSAGLGAAWCAAGAGGRAWHSPRACC